MHANTSTGERRGQTYWGNLSIVPSGCRRSCSCSRCLLSRRLHGGRLPQLPIGLQGGEVVDRCKLDQGGEDEGKANGDEPIHCCGVRNFGEGVAGADAERGHGQDGGDPCVQEGDRRQEHAAHTDRLVEIWVSLNFTEDILWNIPGSSLQIVVMWSIPLRCLCLTYEAATGCRKLSLTFLPTAEQPVIAGDIGVGVLAASLCCCCPVCCCVYSLNKSVTEQRFSLTLQRQTSKAKNDRNEKSKIAPKIAQTFLIAQPSTMAEFH